MSDAAWHADARATPHGLVRPRGEPPRASIETRENASYRAGVAGEQRTAGVLAVLERAGYRVLHSVPLSPRKDIDHLVIGPAGMHVLNTKTTSYEVAAKADGAVYADGYRQTWLESLERDAAIAAETLSAAARMDLECVPLVAVWSTVGIKTASRHLIAGERVAERIESAGSSYPPEWVDVVYSTARRSDTWTARH